MANVLTWALIYIYIYSSSHISHSGNCDCPICSHTINHLYLFYIYGQHFADRAIQHLSVGRWVLVCLSPGTKGLSNLYEFKYNTQPVPLPRSHRTIYPLYFQLSIKVNNVEETVFSYNKQK